MILHAQRPVPSRFKKAAEEPGPIADYSRIQQVEDHHDTDCVRQTTESLQTILHLVLLMCIVAKAPELIFGAKDFVVSLLRRKSKSE